MKVKDLIEELKVVETTPSILEYNVFANINNKEEVVGDIKIEDDLSSVTLEEEKLHEKTEEKIFDKLFNEVYIGDEILFVANDSLNKGIVESFNDVVNDDGIVVGRWELRLKVYDNSIRVFNLSHMQFVKI